MNIPKRVDLAPIIRGIDFVAELTVCSDDDGEVPVDLTGYSAYVAFREGKLRTDTLIVDFTTALTEVDGIVTITLTDTQTDAITQDYGYYGLLLVDAAGVSQPWIWGKIKVEEDFPTTEQ